MWNGQRNTVLLVTQPRLKIFREITRKAEWTTTGFMKPNKKLTYLHEGDFSNAPYMDGIQFKASPESRGIVF